MSGKLALVAIFTASNKYPRGLRICVESLSKVSSVLPVLNS